MGIKQQLRLMEGLGYLPVKSLQIENVVSAHLGDIGCHSESILLSHHTWQSHMTHTNDAECIWELSSNGASGGFRLLAGKVMTD